MFTQDRNRLRLFYCEVWERYRNNLPLQPLEQQIGEVISMHPEYHELLEDREAALGMEANPELGESNPFLHLALHVSIREQIGSDQPSGIRKIHGRLLVKLGDAHRAEHRMMECLAAELWQAQQDGSTLDGAAYMRRLERV
ncbi:MAG TPA: DUF1841 family protein [Gammaproteobacteria bacterium]|nr:DUF1841 family protein [Gammaproteobacteria bacterium]